MTVGLHWFLPTSGDGRSLVESGEAKRSAEIDRPTSEQVVTYAPSLDHLEFVARAAEEAWRAADALIAGADVVAAQRVLATLQSVGQSRMIALHGGRLDQLEVYPNLWAGIGLVRGGAGTALVRRYDQVADQEYHAAGFDEFILSGWPHAEEARRFGAAVVPELRALGLA